MDLLEVMLLIMLVVVGEEQVLVDQVQLRQVMVVQE
jgi:hypothetical protein|tara:strand:- start:198 stop:305 length:108 start_codon:yes stop_codon:yes gene_type:complete